MGAIAFAATCRLFISCCRFSVCCWLSTKAALQRLPSALFLIAMHAWERLSTRGSDVAGGQSAALGSLHVKAAGADGLAGLELSSFQNDLDGSPLGGDESAAGYTIMRLRGRTYSAATFLAFLPLGTSSSTSSSSAFLVAS
jgi:hypothetical protein